MESTKFQIIEELKKIACEFYLKIFEKSPEICVAAPGRVNLIGEHTDYNDGYVLPIAIPLVTIIVGRKIEGTNCSVVTNAEHADEPKRITFSISSSAHPLASSPSDFSIDRPQWGQYVKGVVANFHGPLNAFEAVIASSVPMGGGLSSSASLEVATYTFLEELMGNRTDLKQKALSCQKAEHDYANMPCGIMDQFASCLCKSGSALLLDCESSETTLVPINDPDVTILVTNSNVRHNLSGSEYPLRRKQCETAAKLLGKRSLRNVTIKELENCKEVMDPITFNRAKHVITEIERTVQAAEALKNNDFEKFGKLMIESHNSLRNDYEVSCKELDQLVNEAVNFDGVYGSRMTGGGFGGCTVSLVKKNKVGDLISHLQKTYSGTPTFYVCEASDGARVLPL